MYARTITAAALAGAALFTAAPAEAAATTVWVHHGADYAFIDSVTSAGKVVDGECDGHKVRVRVTGRKFVAYVTDSNGCKAGGTSFDYGNVDAIRIEEQMDDGSWSVGESSTV